MAERKRATVEERGYAELLRDLTELETWNAARKLKERALPRDWYRITANGPERVKRVKLTMNLDADVVAWFRALGKGHQARMNEVLRAYMLAVLSKEIETPDDRDWRGAPL